MSLINDLRPCIEPRADCLVTVGACSAIGLGSQNRPIERLFEVLAILSAIVAADGAEKVIRRWVALVRIIANVAAGHSCHLACAEDQGSEMP